MARSIIAGEILRNQDFHPMQEFIANTPVWVWPLFIILVAIGHRSTKDRKSPVWLYYFLPLLGIMSLRTVSALPLPQLSIPVWVMAWVAGSVIGHGLQGRWVIKKNTSFVRVQGEWLTISMIMVLFFSNFFLGVMRNTSPDTINSPLFLCVFLIVVGLAAGTFMGRSVKILRL